MINHPPLQVNLPDTLEQASFFTTEPFTIFEMDNFVNEDFYHALVADVNARQDFDRIFKNKGDKKKMSLGGHNIHKAEDSPFKTLVAYFLSEEFFAWFDRTHLPTDIAFDKTDGFVHGEGRCANDRMILVKSIRLFAVQQAGFKALFGRFSVFGIIELRAKVLFHFRIHRRGRQIEHKAEPFARAVSVRRDKPVFGD